MKIQLSHIDQAPAALPIWQQIMDDLCEPPPKRVARVLGLSERTIYRYNATGQAPRVVLLALFWLTTWGRSQVDCKAVNDARLMAGLARSLDTERAELLARIDDLEASIRMRTTRIQSAPGGPNEQALPPRALRVPESHFGTFWKVLLEPSLRSGPAAAPADPAGSSPDKAALGARQVNGTPAVLPAGPGAARPDRQAARPVDLEPGAAAFATMAGGLTGRAGGTRKSPNSRSVGRAGTSVPPAPSAHAKEASAAHGSLPLADRTDARSGTPPSAPALRASPAASGRKGGA